MAKREPLLTGTPEWMEAVVREGLTGRPEPGLPSVDVRTGDDERIYVYRRGRIIGQLAYDAEWDDENPWQARGVITNLDGDPWLIGMGATPEEAAINLARIWDEEGADAVLEGTQDGNGGAW